MWIVSASVTSLTWLWKDGSAQARRHLLEVAALCSAPEPTGPGTHPDSTQLFPSVSWEQLWGEPHEFWTILCFDICRENVTLLLEYVLVLFFFKRYSLYQWPHLSQHSFCLKGGNYKQVIDLDIAGEWSEEGTSRETKYCYLSKQKKRKIFLKSLTGSYVKPLKPNLNITSFWKQGDCLLCTQSLCHPQVSQKVLLRFVLVVVMVLYLLHQSSCWVCSGCLTVRTPVSLTFGNGAGLK